MGLELMMTDLYLNKEIARRFYEHTAEKKIPVLVWAILFPISLLVLIVMAWFMMPFVKPLTSRQILFTYLNPINLYLLCLKWSLPIMYSIHEVGELLDGPEKRSNGKNYKLT
jgi:hypothetical protein